MSRVVVWGKARDLVVGDVAGLVEVKTLGALLSELEGTGATVVLADPKRLTAEQEQIEAWQHDGGASNAVLVAVTEPKSCDTILERFPFLDDVITGPVTPTLLKRRIERAFERIQHRQMTRQLEKALYRKHNELSKLNEVGVALSAERDIDWHVGFHSMLPEVGMRYRLNHGSVRFTVGAAGDAGFKFKDDRFERAEFSAVFDGDDTFYVRARLGF